MSPPPVLLLQVCRAAKTTSGGAVGKKDVGGGQRINEREEVSHTQWSSPRFLCNQFARLLASKVRPRTDKPQREIRWTREDDGGAIGHAMEE
ncbi:hypothetical protein MTO96_027017 [Rhipicephalus appendiculatus]